MWRKISDWSFKKQTTQKHWEIKDFLSNEIIKHRGTVLFSQKPHRCCNDNPNSVVSSRISAQQIWLLHTMTWQWNHHLVPNLYSGKCHGLQIWIEWRATSDKLAGRCFSGSDMMDACHNAHMLNRRQRVTAWHRLVVFTDVVSHQSTDSLMLEDLRSFSHLRNI